MHWVSVIPPSQAERKHKQEEYTLQAVNHTAIPTFSNGSLTLDIGLRRTFRWIFVIADLKNPILGADFLRHYSLMVDVKRNKLLDSLTQLVSQHRPHHPAQPFALGNMAMRMKLSWQSSPPSLNLAITTFLSNTVSLIA